MGQRRAHCDATAPRRTRARTAALGAQDPTPATLPLNDLPPELLVHIFQSPGLPPAALARLRLACSSWRGLLDSTLIRLAPVAWVKASCPATSFPALITMDLSSCRVHSSQATKAACITRELAALPCLATLTICPKDAPRGTGIRGTALRQLLAGLWRLKALQRLRVSSAALDSLPARLCAAGSPLKVLRLEDNELTSLPPALGRLSALEELHVRGNKLEALPDAIGRLGSLRMLDVTENALTALPASIGSCSALQFLGASWNKMEVLPDELGQLVELEHLDLSDNELITLPPSLMELSSLRTLRLSGNWQLCGLPPGPGALGGLELLDITGTGVAALPPWLGQLKLMQELLAGSNDLQEFPPCVRDMPRLRMCSIEYNNISTLPEWLGELPSLEVLDASGNGLKALPAGLGKLTTLQTLHLGSNQLEVLPPELRGLSRLQDLDLASNALTELPDSLLSSLGRLDYLSLAGNAIVALPPLLALPPSLRWLDVSDNAILEVPSCFIDLTQLQVLKLHGNPLEEHMPEVLAHLRHLELDVVAQEADVRGEGAARHTGNLAKTPQPQWPLPPAAGGAGQAAL